MAISMVFAVAASLKVGGQRQCSHFDDSEVLTEPHCGIIGNVPLYIPLLQNEGISRISGKT